MERAETPTIREERRDLPPLALRAAVRSGSVNREERTVEVVWTTGARVLRGFWDRFWEELSLDKKHVRMERLASGRAPVLNSHVSHSLDAVIGVVQSARIENGQGVAVLRFPQPEDDPEADKIFRKVADGIIANVSVGYRVYKFEKVEDGADTIPVYRATDWEPFEISLVGMGADAGAGVRSAELGEPMPCVIVSREEKNMPANTEDGTQTREASAPAPSTDAGTTPTPATGGEVARAAEAATRAERERVTGIRQAVRAARLGEDLADELIRTGVPLDQARATILERLAAASESIRTEQHTRVEGGEDERDKWLRGATAALFVRAGLASLLRQAREALPEHPAFRDLELDPGEFRGMRAYDLARDSLERQGVRTRGLDQLDLVGRAFAHRSAYNGTSDFAVLFENAMHKTLLAAYAVTPDTWQRFCRRGSVTDFRAHRRYRVGSFGTLDSKNEHGEFKQKQIPDGERVSISIGTKGNIIAITREAIINDDLGAMLDLASRLGRAAKLSIEVDVYGLLGQNGGLGPTQADGQPFFHSSRGNVGTASALSVDGIEADRVLMAQQRDPAGNEILDLRPSILLVPIGLGGEARVINSAEFNPSVTSKFQVPNKVRGLFSVIVDSPRLTGTRRYLLADPAIAPAFEVAFLEGREEPYLESRDGWRVDGVEWKVRLDYGVAAVDPRGAVTNAGTAS